MSSRVELPTIYTEYQDLVDYVYSAAMSKGLAFQNPVTVNLPVGGDSLSANRNIPLPTELEVLVTCDELALPYYRLGTVWLNMLPGHRYYRMFCVSMAEQPDDEDWYPLTTGADVVSEQFRTATVAYIQRYVADHGGGGGGGGGNLEVARFTIGNNVSKSFTLNHGFATRDVGVTVFEVSSQLNVFPGVLRTDSNNVRLDFTYPITSNSHRVLILNLSA